MKKDKFDLTIDAHKEINVDSTKLIIEQNIYNQETHDTQHIQYIENGFENFMDTSVNVETKEVNQEVGQFIYDQEKNP